MITSKQKAAKVLQKGGEYDLVSKGKEKLWNLSKLLKPELTVRDLLKILATEKKEILRTNKTGNLFC